MHKRDTKGMEKGALCKDSKVVPTGITKESQQNMAHMSRHADNPLALPTRFEYLCALVAPDPVRLYRSVNASVYQMY